MDTSSFRKEFAALKRRDLIEDVVVAVIAVVIAVAAYFLDEARVAAFGIIPALSIFTYASMRGVSMKNTPRLFWTLCFVCFVLYACALAWVHFNPKI